MSVVRPLIMTIATCLLSVVSLGWLVLCVAAMPNSPADRVNWLIAFAPLTATVGAWLFAIGAWVGFLQRRW